MSILGDIFGTGKQTSTQTTTPQVPSDVEAARRDLTTRARAFAAEPFPVYNQPRVAGFVADQTTGFQTARDLAKESGALGALTPDLIEESIAASRGLATTLPETNLQPYMSPYTQAVLDPAIREIEERAARQRLALGQQAARAGAFGGSRQAIAESELERGTQRNIGEETARQNQQAYNQALAQFRLDQERIPQLYSGAIGQIGTGLNQVANRFSTEVNPLLQVGGAQQNLNQRNLDVLREQFLEERDYPIRGMEVLRGALGLTPQTLGISSSQQTTQPGANPLSTIIGGATQIPQFLSGLQSLGNFFGKLF